MNEKETAAEGSKDKIKDTMAEDTYQAIAYQLSILVEVFSIDSVVNVINEEFGELIVELRRGK